MLFYEWITDTLSFGVLLTLPTFVISSIIAMIVPSSKKARSLPFTLSGASIWVVCMILSVSLTFSYVYIRDLPPVLFTVEYAWDKEIEIDFRENHTFKAIYRDLVNSSIFYGSYSLEDSMIILRDDLFFGISEIKDTLFIMDEGVAFQLDPPVHGISHGMMTYKE